MLEAALLALAVAGFVFAGLFVVLCWYLWPAVKRTLRDLRNDRARL